MAIIPTSPMFRILKTVQITCGLKMTTRHISSHQHSEFESTRIWFYYYYNTDNPDLCIQFAFIGDGVVFQTNLSSTGDQWSYYSFTCGFSCCVNYPCSGYFELDYFEYYYRKDTSLCAIDAVEINNGCSLTTTTPSPETTTTLPLGPGCCEFTTDTCGFPYRSPPQKGSWDWSGAGNTPNSTLFPLFPGANVSYIFTQNDDKSFTNSQQITVDATTEIGLTYYAHIEDTTGASSLRLYFENSNGFQDVLLDVLDETNEKWLYRSLTCGSHDCCRNYPCTGSIKVIADVTYPNALYAIDEVEINNACTGKPL